MLFQLSHIKEAMMKEYHNRFYRFFSENSRWSSFRVKVETTDLFIRARDDLSKDVTNIVEKLREELRDHIKRQSCFMTALQPVRRHDESYPEIIERMYRASEIANVGPMASVAGTIAELVGESLLSKSEEVIVENGGDIYLKIVKPAIISIFSGLSSFSGRIGIRIYPETTPVGVCTSSGRFGHSLSLGRADTATIISKCTALADAVATETCNIVKIEKDLDTAIEYATNINDVYGAIIIYRDKLVVKGNIELAYPESN